MRPGAPSVGVCVGAGPEEGAPCWWGGALRTEDGQRDPGPWAFLVKYEQFVPRPQRPRSTNMIIFPVTWAQLLPPASFTLFNVKSTRVYRDDFQLRDTRETRVHSIFRGLSPWPSPAVGGSTSSPTAREARARARSAHMCGRTPVTRLSSPSLQPQGPSSRLRVGQAWGAPREGHPARQVRACASRTRGFPRRS